MTWTIANISRMLGLDDYLQAGAVGYSEYCKVSGRSGSHLHLYTVCIMRPLLGVNAAWFTLCWRSYDTLDRSASVDPY